MPAAAVVFGNRYNVHRDELKSCHQDAKVVAEGLRSGQFLQDVQLHLDATKNEMCAAIYSLSKKASKGASLTWLHFSGHGYRSRDGDLFLCPSDSGVSDGNISLESIIEVLRRTPIPRNHKRLHIITLDCCQTRTDYSSVSALCIPGRPVNGRILREVHSRRHNFSSVSASGHEIVIFYGCEKNRAMADKEDPDRPNAFSGNLARLLHGKDRTLSYITKTVTFMVMHETSDQQQPSLDMSCPESFDLIITGTGPIQNENHLLNRQRPRHQQNGRFFVACDGNIGCGKTTFLNFIAKHKPVGLETLEIFREPVAERAQNSWWHLLAQFYHVMKKNAYNEVFSKALQELGILPLRFFNDLAKKLKKVHKKIGHQPTLILYFKIDPAEALERIKKRAMQEGRFFEMDIHASYLFDLHAKYEALYENREDVITIASNCSAPSIKNQIVNQLRDNSAKYCAVIETKGYLHVEAEQILRDMITLFGN